jgi:hypothetical protein
VFFAAFGSLVLYYSLTEEVIITQWVQSQTPKQQANGGDIRPDTIHIKSFTGISGTPGSGVTPQQRSKALITIEMLNCAQRMLSGEVVRPDLEDQISLAIRDAKRTLILSVWDEGDWGPADQLGITGPTENAPFQLRNMFNATYEDCPK